jgi:transposase-like protein
METIDVFDKQFPTDEACKQFIVEMRWPDGVRCPRCNASERIYALKARPFHWVCCNKGCGERRGYRFSVTTKTIFENTKISLKLWFKVAYLVLTSKKGISALQVHRMIFGEESTHAYHTSWYMVMRWRAAMKGDAFSLSGEVEVDETYIGGKDRNRHWSKKSAQQRKTKGKQPFGEAVGYGKVGVVGAIARKGNVVARVIGGMDARTLKGFVNRTVGEKVTLIATDENQAYTYIDPHKMNVHRVVNHTRGEYVRGSVHTNNIESFWSLIKRGVIGTYHHVSKDYLPLYLNEFSWRFNNRKNSEMFADLIQGIGR